MQERAAGPGVEEKGQTPGLTRGLTLDLTRGLTPGQILKAEAEGDSEGTAAVLAEEWLRELVVCGHLPEAGSLQIGDGDPVGVHAAGGIDGHRAIPGDLLLVVQDVVELNLRPGRD